MEELVVRYWPQVAIVIALAVAWGDLRTSFNAHRETTKQGFEGTHSRLDKVNGRLDKAENNYHDLSVKVAKIEARNGE
jgi:hypothetical protein